jgi:hypothetical protein
VRHLSRRPVTSRSQRGSCGQASGQPLLMVRRGQMQRRQAGWWVLIAAPA